MRASVEHTQRERHSVRDEIKLKSLSKNIKNDIQGIMKNS